MYTLPSQTAHETRKTHRKKVRGAEQYYSRKHTLTSSPRYRNGACPRPLLIGRSP